jgi:aminomethyltransferase
MTLQRTPLFERHIAHGARMVPFGGWEMPVQYSGILDEHNAVRSAAGVFDISHMGRLIVRGPDALAFLQHVATCDVSAIPVGQSNYGLLCHEHGGIVDDIFIYHLPDAYMVVVNASNRAKDWDWLQAHAAGFDVQLQDRSAQWAMLAVQGPQAEALLSGSEQVHGVNLAALPFHGVAACRLFGDGAALIARTGYTGEDGFELFFDAARAAEGWDAIIALGVKPCGLGARDSLRFEACLALYGHEIADDVNPYEARLGWVVKLDKGAFVGRDALAAIKAAGPARRLTGFELVGRGVARGDYPVQSVDGERVGHVTTGMPAPSLANRPLGMAFVPTALSKEGAEFDVLVRDKPVRARAVKMPFYKPRYKK